MVDGSPATSSRVDTRDASRAAAPFLQVEHISKSFGLARVLNDVSLDFFPGEVHALIGENGAGKSTLVKIMAGVHSPDQGHLRIDGEDVVFSNPIEAKARGVEIILQEPALFPDLSIAENIFIGRQPRQSGRPWLDKREMNRRTHELLESIGSFLPPDRQVRGLSVAEEQMVDIASAISRDPRLLIVDEPTASLTPAEVDRLFELFRALCQRGVGIVFIGHRLAEAFAISQWITVLRDGELVASRASGEFTEASLISAMVGREMQGHVARESVAQPSDVVLEVRDLGKSGVFRGISFDIRAGEVLGMAGLVGSGRSDIASAIFGIEKHDAGQVTLNGRLIPPGQPHRAVLAGIGYVPEDRKTQGLAERLPILTNASTLILSRLSRFGWLDRAEELSTMSGYFASLKLKAKRPKQTVGELSGGNQQKVVLSKWLAIKPKLLILDEPTRGVDVGAKDELHRLIGQLANEGVAILLISSDMSEVLALSDRVAVVRDGRLVTVLPRGTSAEETLRHMVLGLDAVEAQRERNR